MVRPGGPPGRARLTRVPGNDRAVRQIRVASVRDPDNENAPADWPGSGTRSPDRAACPVGIRGGDRSIIEARFGDYCRSITVIQLQVGRPTGAAAADEARADEDLCCTTRMTHIATSWLHFACSPRPRTACLTPAGSGVRRFVRSAAAALNMFSNGGIRHERPDFGIGRVTVGGIETEVTEEAVAIDPFCRLVHFRKAEAPEQPKLLVVAPLSGHFATLLRGTVATVLPDHDVYVTDWVNARNVPVQYGRFDLDDEIELLDQVHPAARAPTVTSGGVSALRAGAGGGVADGGSDDPCQPASMVLMGGPIDPAANPTEVNRFAQSHSLSWFEHMVITTVPARYPGAFRRVYPGFLQLAGFLSMNFDRHVEAHWRMFRHLVEGDGESAAATRAFYDEYSTVMDLPADFYLQTVDGCSSGRIWRMAASGCAANWSIRARSSAPR